MAKKKFDVEQHENDILTDFEKGELQSVDNAAEEMTLAKEAAENYFRKSNNDNFN
jgi:hypothetical protein